MTALYYKLVETFSGICERKLYLKDAQDGRPKTNGYYIEIPFQDENAYQYTEHEISHILFQSDGTAKERFIEEYVAKLLQVARKNKHLVNPKTLKRALDGIISILDDERVISLWGQLYWGSEVRMRRMKYHQAMAVIGHAHDDLITMFSMVAGRCDNIPPGKLDRFQPSMVEALRKVQKCDYYGCLVVGKWLIVQWVSEILRQSRDIPPLPGQSPLPGRFEDLKARPQQWDNQEIEATGEERAAALRKMIDQVGQPPEELIDEVTGAITDNPKVQAVSALRTPVKDEAKLEKALNTSSRLMTKIIEKARKAVRNTPTHDDHVRRDAYAKVVFKDIHPSPHADPHAELQDKDEEVVRRLRAIFHRIMGRRTNVLDDAGTQIDIPAFLEYKMTRVPAPVFRVERSGRGFRSLILVDRSTSMVGSRTKQAERACRIISKALKFPFVTRAVWGFQSWEHGVVDITRFQPGREIFESDSAMVGGVTPLHTAIRVAIRELEDNNTDRKHLFVISDGFPVFASHEGKIYGTGTLMTLIRHNVAYARTKGIGVTGILIGTDVTEYAMRYMFGSDRNWAILKEDDFGNDLIKLVSGTFTDYLGSA